MVEYDRMFSAAVIFRRPQVGLEKAESMPRAFSRITLANASHCGACAGVIFSLVRRSAIRASTRSACLAGACWAAACGVCEAGVREVGDREAGDCGAGAGVASGASRDGGVIVGALGVTACAAAIAGKPSVAASIAGARRNIMGFVIWLISNGRSRIMGHRQHGTAPQCLPVPTAAGTSWPRRLAFMWPSQGITSAEPLRFRALARLR